MRLPATAALLQHSRLLDIGMIQIIYSDVALIEILMIKNILIVKHF